MAAPSRRTRRTQDVEQPDDPPTPDISRLADRVDNLEDLATWLIVALYGGRHPTNLGAGSAQLEERARFTLGEWLGKLTR